LGDNLFTAAFNGATANQITMSSKEIIAHTMAVVGKVSCCLSGFVVFSAQALTSKNHFFDLSLPEQFHHRG
jgi:hypothetical protein